MTHDRAHTNKGQCRLPHAQSEEHCSTRRTCNHSMLLQCCPQRSRWQGFRTVLCSVEIFSSCFITGQTTHAVSEEAQCRHRMSHCKPSTIKVAKLSAHVCARCKYSTIDSSPGTGHWHVLPTAPVNKDNAGCHMRSRKNTAQHAAHATIPCSSSVALNDQGGKVSALFCAR